MKKIVIIGCGFAGLRLARMLSNRKNFDVTLIDRLNYHQFQPLLYQVATAGLEPSDISFPLRRALQKSKNVHVRLADVQFVDLKNKKVTASDFETDYDMLVIATGAVSNYFGNKEIERFSLGMKSSYDAIKLRNHLLKCFESALKTTSKTEQEKLLTIVVAGAGATGVEISGAIADMRRFVLHKDFPELDLSLMKILLIDTTTMPLRNMSSKSSEKALKYLTHLGVEMIPERKILSYDGEKIILDNEQIIPSATLIWAAGVIASTPQGFEQGVFTRGNRLKVNEYNQVEGVENVFAVGDVAFMQTEKYPNGHPQVASVANAQAKNLAKNLLSISKTGNPKTTFRYIDRGTMATVGRNLAVFDLPKPHLHLGGSLAWFCFMALHLLLILGVKNRFSVLINWMYNYITYDQSLRLILESQSSSNSKTTEKDQ